MNQNLNKSLKKEISESIKNSDMSDESLKNYIGKNLIEHNIGQPYENNEFRKFWQSVPRDDVMKWEEQGFVDKEFWKEVGAQGQGSTNSL